MSALLFASDAILRAASLIESADSLLVAAGAGMGVDSGLPDFRGTHGFWTAYPALKKSGIDFYRIACPDAFRADPEIAWGFYGHRLALYRRTKPHDGFQVLRRWGKRMAHGLAVFTSNVDGHFERAGYEPGDINECHGSIHHLQCLHRCSNAIWSADDLAPDVDESQCRLRSPLPRCPECGSLARPNVLMFNDWKWNGRPAEVQSARQQKWLESTSRLVVVELGAGSVVPSVRYFSQHLIQRRNARLIRINPREPDVPTARDVGLPMSALAGLMAIDAALRTQ